MTDPMGNIYYRGKWEYCTEYDTGDTVIRAGQFFMCLLGCAGYDPVDPFNRNFWKPYANEDFIKEAPLDGKMYGRRYGEWDVITQAYYRGAFSDAQALINAHPSDVVGAFAVVLGTGTFWIWDGSAWVDTGKDASGVGIEEAPLDGEQYARQDGAWAQVTASGGVSSHDDLTDVHGRGEQHVSEQDLEFIGDYVERRPIRPINLSPVDGELELGEQPLFESTPYLHPFNIPIYGYQLQIFDTSDAIIFDTGNLEMATVQYRLAAGILQANTPYKWQVRYQGGNLQWSEWSDATRFTTQSTLSSADIIRPGVLKPAQREILNSPFASIVTTPFEATGGLIQGNGLFEVGTTPEFTSIVDSGVGKNSWIGSVELSRGANYFARAKHKAVTGEESSWSYPATFLIKKLFRDTRVGVVALDEERGIFQNVDRDFSPVHLDPGFFANHPVWAGWEASRNSGANTVIAGQEMIVVPKFNILSGYAPVGTTYEGKRFWMIDTAEPSTVDVTAGWHIHHGFYSPLSGYMDSLKISAHRIRDVGGAPKSIETGDPYQNNVGNVKTFMTKINTDPSDRLKSGWHIMDYTELQAILLLALIELRSSVTIYDDYLARATPYRGLPIFDYSSSRQLSVDGVFIGSVIGRDKLTLITIPSFAVGLSNSVARISKFYSDKEGADVAMDANDYLLPYFMQGDTGTLNYKHAAIRSSWRNESASASYGEQGAFGLFFCEGSYQYFMCKWD